MTTEEIEKEWKKIKKGTRFHYKSSFLNFIGEVTEPKDGDDFIHFTVIETKQKTTKIGERLIFTRDNCFLRFWKPTEIFKKSRSKVETKNKKTITFSIKKTK